MINSIFSPQDILGMRLSEQRVAQVAQNIANANTPYYKAKDMNFEEAMRGARDHFNMTHTDARHLTPAANTGARWYYRIPMQLREDGNTVDADIERKNFMQSHLQYQMSLGFLERKSSEVIKALRGE